MSMDVHSTSTRTDADGDLRFNSFRYELESGTRRLRFVIALAALIGVLALTLFSLNRLENLALEVRISRLLPLEELFSQFGKVYRGRARWTSS